CTGYYGSRDYW
nr:immunoglobulin heavy chain junction region [Mus musculus]